MTGWSGRKRLTARLDAGATFRATGSLMMSAPGGMTMEGLPLKVRAVELAAVMSLVPALRAIWAAPMVRGSTPNSLVRMTRIEGPPMEMWTISRRVVPSVPGAPNLPSGFLAAIGEAAQVPTQWSAGGVAFVTRQQRRSRGRRERARYFVDMTILNANWIEVPSYRCFVEARALTYSGGGRWSAEDLRRNRAGN